METGLPPAGCHSVLTFGGWLCAPGANTLISYLGKQGFKMTLRTLMYFSTGVTGRMRNRSGSSILGFGVGGSSSPSSSCNITPEMDRVRLRLVGPFSASPPRTRHFAGDLSHAEKRSVAWCNPTVRKGPSGDRYSRPLLCPLPPLATC